MTTLELRLPTARFRQFVTATQAASQPTLTVDPGVAAAVGHHLLIQEFDGPCFTGNWVRTRVVDVVPTTKGPILALSLLAKNAPTTVRRRAA
jgi:hypothetical protein